MVTLLLALFESKAVKISGAAGGSALVAMLAITDYQKKEVIQYVDSKHELVAKDISHIKDDVAEIRKKQDTILEHLLNKKER